MMNYPNKIRSSGKAGGGSPDIPKFVTYLMRNVGEPEALDAVKTAFPMKGGQPVFTAPVQVVADGRTLVLEDDKQVEEFLSMLSEQAAPSVMSFAGKVHRAFVSGNDADMDMPSEGKMAAGATEGMADDVNMENMPQSEVSYPPKKRGMVGQPQSGGMRRPDERPR